MVMSRLLTVLIMTLAMTGLSACDDTEFVSRWEDPEMRQVRLRGTEVAAVLLSDDEGVRRAFERDLARELRLYGVEGVPGYEVVSTDVTDKEAVVRTLRREGIDYAIIMKIIGSEQETRYIPGSGYYTPYYYDPYWRGGYYYDPGYYVTNVLVSVETVLQSVPDDKVLFAGTTRTINPDEVDELVEDIVEVAAKELNISKKKDADVE
jgi:hypothetical protein